MDYYHLALDNDLHTRKAAETKRQFDAARSEIPRITDLAEEYIGKLVTLHRAVRSGKRFQYHDLERHWSAEEIFQFTSLNKYLGFSDDEYPQRVHNNRRLEAVLEGAVHNGKTLRIVPRHTFGIAPALLRGTALGGAWGTITYLIPLAAGAPPAIETAGIAAGGIMGASVAALEFYSMGERDPFLRTADAIKYRAKKLAELRQQ